MLNRVTNLTMTAAAQRTLQTQQSKLAALQDQASTLNKISRPSDDPAATAQALATRNLQAANAQYGRNIDDGNTWLSAADSALQQATNLMQRIKDLTVQAGNATLPQSGKDAIANELDSLNQDLINVANSKHLGRNIFAGNSDKAEPFTKAMPPIFVAAASPVERRVSETQTVRVDVDGAGVFGSGTGSVFDVVNKLATDLRNGVDTLPRVGEIDDAYKTIVNGRADVGARQAQLDRAGTFNTGMEASLDAQRTGIEKADLGSVIMDLKLQETNYQVALAATARVLQPTLMDFLR